MIRKLINVLLVIILIATSISLITLSTFKLTIGKNGIKRIISNVSSEILTDETAMNNIKKEIINEFEIDEEIFDYVMKSETAQEIISEILDNVISYSLGDTKKMTNQEVYNLASDNIDKISKEAGYKLTETEKKELLNEIKENSNQFLESIYGDENE